MRSLPCPNRRVPSIKVHGVGTIPGCRRASVLVAAGALITAGVLTNVMLGLSRRIALEDAAAATARGQELTTVSHVFPDRILG